MLMIISHHYVVNSTITALYDLEHITSNMLFLQIFGWGGKVGINCFLLVTGYFSCKQDFQLKKFLKLIFMIYFYKIILTSIFVITGYEVFSFKLLFKTVFILRSFHSSGFSSIFILLYCLMPFINVLIKNISKKQMIILISVLMYAFSIAPTFLFASGTAENIGWYVTVYLIGAYIRLHSNKYFESARVGFWTSFVSLGLSWLSIIVVDFIGNKIGFDSYYHMFGSANKFLAIVCAIAFFLLFKNISIKPSKIINTIATATFGVLLIHANSDTMRSFLWQDLLKVPEMYNSQYLVIHAITSVLAIYVICVIIELLRIKFIEKPFFKRIDTKLG